MHTQAQRTRPLASFLLAVTGGSVYVVHADSEHSVHRLLTGAKRNARITRRLTRGEARGYGLDQHISLPLDASRLLAAVH